MSKLLEQLRCLPEFNKFEVAFNEALRTDNPLIESFYDDRYNELGKYGQADDCFDEETLDEFLDSGNDEVDDFFLDYMQREVVDLCVALAKELRK
jgi:hypothetical protein